MPFLPIDLTDDKRNEALREMLLILDGRCDGAFRQDRMGFNREDAITGRELSFLALHNDLSKEDLEDAREILFKYWRQFSPGLFDRAYGKGAWKRLHDRHTQTHSHTQT